MLQNYCNIGRTNWASEVKKLLYHYGFGYVWENQETLENDVFLDEFKTRVFDSDKQVWSASMSSMPQLRTLGLFKTNLFVENYLLLHIPRRLKVLYGFQSICKQKCKHLVCCKWYNWMHLLTFGQCHP